ncbi:uncharacterized protein A4U43_C08F2420 [Asparagus officinalis]|nr:uncharacterized protein A4U43_C08F2420 [Asparagus officinalis]
MNGGDKTLSDAWDYNGRPAVRFKTGGWSAAAMILGVELNERLTTLGIAVNLVTYITGTMHLGNAVAANTVTNFMGTSFLLCLFGGFLADTYIGRYLTIAVFSAIQASGVIILTISIIAPGLRPPDHKPATTPQLSVLYISLYLTALGTGGVKSSVSGFGSDQFDETNTQEKKSMSRFFSWFFFFINLGSLLAVTVLVYIQDNVGREWGYGACAGSIVVGLMVFLAGTRRYRYKKLVGSPLTQIAAVVAAAWRKRSSWTAGITPSFPSPPAPSPSSSSPSVLLINPPLRPRHPPLLPRPPSPPFSASASASSLSCLAMAAAALIELRRLHSHVAQRAADSFLADPPVFLVGSEWRSRYVGAARFLPARVPEGDEDHEHGPVPEHPVAGVLRSSGSWRDA